MEPHPCIAWILIAGASLTACSTRADTSLGVTNDPVASEERVDATPGPSPDDAAPLEAEPSPETELEVASARDAVDAPPESDVAAEPVDEAQTDDVGLVASGEDEPSPSPVPEAAPSLLEVPDANLTIDGVSADGQRLDVLQCNADRLPLLGSMAVVASIAEQKRALDRCAPKGGAAAVVWSFRRGKAQDVTVAHASSPAVGRCIAKAMRKVVAPFEARCGAVVLVGNEQGADDALAKLEAEAMR